MVDCPAAKQAKGGVSVSIDDEFRAFSDRYVTFDDAAETLFARQLTFADEFVD
jgi:hypothetical protein